MAALDLGAATLRANPAYRALPFNRLSPADRHAVSVLPAVDNAFGVLLPDAGSGLPLFVIGRETALAFLTLRHAGPPPDHMLEAGGEGVRALRQLILDRVLEIAGHDGGFVHGVAALELLGAEDVAGRGALAELSLAAIRHAAALRTRDAGALTRVLYDYNRRPITRRLRTLLPTRAAVESRLGLDRRATRAPAHWVRASADQGWIHFSPERAPRRAGRVACKLYLGVVFEDAAERLSDIAAALARNAALQFKFAAELAGLMRADKCVAYFEARDDLLGAAQAIAPIVADCRLQAVPFSADIAGNGRLSWGIDPGASGATRSSWRQSICERLAETLVAARASEAAPDAACRYALERLRLDGVDPATFMPTAAW